MFRFPQDTQPHESIGAQKDTDNETFRDFRRRLFHGSLTVIHDPLRPFMYEWDVVRCSDRHFRRAIYGFGPYIADYPEQTATSGTVYNWCVTSVWFTKSHRNILLIWLGAMPNLMISTIPLEASRHENEQPLSSKTKIQSPYGMITGSFPTSRYVTTVSMFLAHFDCDLSHS